MTCAKTIKLNSILIPFYSILHIDPPFPPPKKQTTKKTHADINTRMSSFNMSLTLLCGFSSSSCLAAPSSIYPLSLLCTCPNHVNLLYPTKQTNNQNDRFICVSLSCLNKEPMLSFLSGQKKIITCTAPKRILVSKM